jgi:putative Mg2+ transporter-C (MgtC) family protein
MEILIRMLLAFIAGGIIGFEREKHRKSAGFRTFVLVCLGSCVITIVGIRTVWETIKIVENSDKLSEVIKVDTVRLSAQVVSGIGFLGAGTIIHEKNYVSGLTSAASLWTAAMIGIAIGYGYYFIAIVATIIVVITLLLSSLRNYYSSKTNNRTNQRSREE